MKAITKNNVKTIFPANGKVVFLHAHPDDEAFLSAGLLNLLANIAHYECGLIYCAAGVVPGVESTVIRQREAIDACNILDTKRIYFMNFTEAKHKDVSDNTFINNSLVDMTGRTWDVIRNLFPQGDITLISYDRNGGYGNQDHKMLHRLGRRILAEHNKEVSLFEITIDRDSLSLWLHDANHRLQSNQLPDLSYWDKKFGLPTEEINYFYELSENELISKKRMLATHKSQIKRGYFPISLTAEDFQRVFGKEFVTRV